jgi:TonB-dependent receptor
MKNFQNYLTMKKHFLSFLLIFLTIQVYSQTGTVRGTVYDDATGETILFGNVLVANSTTGTTTDLDGTYFLELAPGIYTLEFSYIGFSTLSISDIEIKAGEVTTLDARLGESAEVMQEVVITARQARNTEAALTTIKRRSTNVLDGISSASFKKMGDSNAAAAVKRVAGVSIEGGKYVFVRGLGDRYTKSILNGLDIPGLDPDRNTIQMDIFPSNIIDNIIVLKSFTADLPADFTGGVVDINTKDFPDTKTSSISVGIGYNPNMHFNSNALTYTGGATDWLGYDDGTRKNPTANSSFIPTKVDVFTDPRNESQYTHILSSFDPMLGAVKETNFMDYSFGYSIGNQINGSKGTFGYNLALTYKNSADFYENAINSRFGKSSDSAETQLQRREHQIGNYSQNSVLLGGLVGLSYKVSNHKFSLNVMKLQNGVSSAGLFDYEGADQGSNFTADQHNLEFSQRSILTGLLRGTHTFGSDGGFTVDWKVSPTLSSIEDPDIRFTRIRTEEGKYSVGTESGIPQRIWRYLEEKNLAGRVDLTKNFQFRDEDAKLKFGGGHTIKERDYEIQGFGIMTGDTDITGDPNDIFKPENYFSLENSNGLFYSPQFIPTNTNLYNAKSNTTSFYVSSEFQLLSSLKAVLGVRAENFTQFYTGINQNKEEFNNVKVIEDFGVFPTANLIFAVNDNVNLRTSFSQTIARPSFKEASFATIIDPLSGRTFIGGFFPDIDVETGEQIWDGNLQNTNINNYDLRLEYYQDRGQNVSLSGFYKSFTNPIEIVQYVQATNNFQPRNVGDGQVLGAELEFMKYLGGLDSKLANFAVNGNITVATSSIKMSDTELTSREKNKRDGETIEDTRAMAGQAPYIVNAGISYKSLSGFETGIFYNVMGRTLQYVGIADRPDVYSQPFHSLNLTAGYSFDKFRVNMKVDNLLGSKRESVFQSYGTDDELFSSLTPYRSIGLSLSYRIM